MPELDHSKIEPYLCLPKFTAIYITLKLTWDNNKKDDIVRQNKKENCFKKGVKKVPFDALNMFHEVLSSTFVDICITERRALLIACTEI